MEDNKTYELMRELTNAEGVPGFEDRAYNVMKKHIEPLSEEIVTDNFGGITGRIGKSGPKILLAGHLDEVGFIVSSITKSGFIKFKALGGWWGHVMLSQRVKVMAGKGDLTGVIGSKAPHVLAPEERKKVLEIDKMFIDIGASSDEEAREFGVEVGDAICPVGELEVLPNPKMLLARNWDNRAGCYVSLKVLERLKGANNPNTLYSGATVQEEVGLRGAQTLVQTIQPDIAFATDVGVAGDTPGMNQEAANLELGKGPIIGFLDRSMIPHRKLRDLAVNIAKDNNIPFQRELMSGGATDGGKFHLEGHGIPTLVVSVPARYIHSHVSIVHQDDLDNAVELLVKVISALDEQTVQSIKGLE
ncbi:M42 family metallopeptidase [Bacillus sp. H-16]|uniref:M42 family metallopeptidase n=1 Tax=Alteribacter salitolerans TaxID=2912333 RepID=UPI0019668CA9|nr:M42 family metallopeptidase [Alteribacter salitolerans]MBM7097573.1 M42 family metallopeptidase [Alteribacter salitolerans]